VAKTYEFTFDAPPELVFTETVSAVNALGFSILPSEDAETCVTFNTGASMWSTAGQDMTATAVAVSPSASKLVVSGKTAPRGNEAQYLSWGERGRIAKGLAARVGGALGDAAPAAAEAPDASSNGSGFVSELARLAELHRVGALTDAEFTKAKQRLLGD
jgi:hypothetical protein